jgi:type IV pilus biogenesis protein CpaD/CtpE
MKPLILVCAAALALSGCADPQKSLTRLDNFTSKYAPLIGRDLIMVANIIVRAECSPGVAPATAQAISVLNIVAPSNSAAQIVISALQGNAAVTQRLCPLVASIQATIGAVPQNVVPSQIVPSTPAT